jgi:hypothetical protein
MVEEGSEPAALKPLPLPLEDKVDGGAVAGLRRFLGDIAEIDLDCGMRWVKQPRPCGSNLLLDGVDNELMQAIDRSPRFWVLGSFTI